MFERILKNGVHWVKSRVFFGASRGPSTFRFGRGGLKITQEKEEDLVDVAQTFG